MAKTGIAFRELNKWVAPFRVAPFRKVPFLRRWLMWAAVRLWSLLRSAFSDGPRDIPRVLLLVLWPGLPIIIGGVIVLAFLLGFWIFEIVALAVLTLLRLVPAARRRLKPPNRPTVFWSP